MGIEPSSNCRMAEKSDEKKHTHSHKTALFDGECVCVFIYVVEINITLMESFICIFTSRRSVLSVPTKLEANQSKKKIEWQRFKKEVGRGKGSGKILGRLMSYLLNYLKMVIPPLLCVRWCVIFVLLCFAALSWLWKTNYSCKYNNLTNMWLHCFDVLLIGFAFNMYQYRHAHINMVLFKVYTAAAVQPKLAFSTAQHTPALLFFSSLFCRVFALPS